MFGIDPAPITVSIVSLIIDRILTFLVPDGVRVGRVRWRRLSGLVDRDHSEDHLVLLFQSLGDLAPQRLLARGRLVHGDLLPRVRLERPLLDDVVGDLGAAVRLRRRPLQLDALLVVVRDLGLPGLARLVW